MSREDLKDLLESMFLWFMCFIAWTSGAVLLFAEIKVPVESLPSVLS
jgi:hypothetical protein